MTPKRLVAITATAVLAASGLSAGLALSLGGHSAVGAQAQVAATAKATYAYYETVTQRHAGERGGSYGAMMDGSGSTAMMGRSGYTWMMGGAGAPGWMMRGSLPVSMMGAGHDPGKVMGDPFANAPGPRVSPAEAAQLGDQVPSGAAVDQSANRVTFASRNVDFAAVASPAMPAENFRVAGLTNPTVVVPVGAHVQIELVNADADMAHGLVVAAEGAQSSPMPMMTAAPAFSGSALWFLGAPTSAGMHAGLLTFSASAAGTYSYFCPVPGHAQDGMVGMFVVQAAS